MLFDQPGYCSLDGGNLFLALFLLLCKHLVDLDVVLVLAGDPADEPDGDLVLHGDIPAGLLLDQERVGDIDNVGGG